MKPFFKTLLLETIIIAIVGFFPYLSWGTAYKLEILSAFLLSLVNAMVGYILVLQFHGSDNATFYKNVYGGMLVRMVFILGFSLYMTQTGILQTIPFFMSLMIFYVIHQWTEISSWLKVLPGRKVQVS
ncbi:MAG: hypothetical protein H8E60_07030 [Candidatus Marinimicrobia bacterium]|nr:hypothetical protein [Candidatus Neomarinimicrobiota bacterium]